MMDYSDFYDIAVYAKENWQASYTPKETACNAYNLYADFEWSKENEKIVDSIRTLYENLVEDVKNIPDNEEAKHWLNMLKKELR